MIYRNMKTGAEIDSPCIISGDNWKLVEDESQELIEDEPIRLSELKVEQLKELAAEMEIDLGAATKKDDIIEIMLAAEGVSAE